MKRNRFLMSALCLLAVLFVKPPDLLAARPNFVMVQVDDLSLRIMNSRIREGSSLAPAMPNLSSQISSRGASFSRFYVNHPLCAPSRASLLGGIMTHNHGMIVNAGERGGWNYWRRSPEYTDNLAIWLDRAGYRTSHFGKFLNGYDSLEKPPGWDRWVAQMQLNRFYDYQFNIDGRLSSTFSSYAKPDKSDCLVALPSVKNFCRHATDLITAYALAEINRAEKAPLYLQINYGAPHDDGRGLRGPEPQTRLKPLRKNVVLPPYRDSGDTLAGKPFFIRDLPALSSAARDEMRVRMRSEILAMRGIDQSLGRIITALGKQKKLANTYIIFTSDNGFFSGEHRLAYGKYLPHEPSTKQPLLIRGPGISSGILSRAPASTIDVAPTILDLAGVTGGGRIDGLSLVPELRRTGDMTDRVVPIEGFNNRLPTEPPNIPGGGNGTSTNRAPIVNFSGFIASRWKYVDYYYGDEELYDIVTDPGEKTNLVDNPEYRTLLFWARILNQDLRDCLGRECRKRVRVP